MPEVRSYPLTLRAIGADGTVEGYGSVFDVRDSYGDIIRPGAFAATIAAHRAAGTMPAMLWQHDPSEPIGIWSSVTEDRTGLQVQGQLALSTARGQEAHALLKMGALNGLSIGFMVAENGWSYDVATDTRTLTEIDLWEVSLVTFPANAAARVTGIKSGTLSSPRDVVRELRSAGIAETDALDLVEHVMRMGETRASAAANAAALAAARRLIHTLTS